MLICKNSIFTPCHYKATDKTFEQKKLDRKKTELEYSKNSCSIHVCVTSLHHCQLSSFPSLAHRIAKQDFNHKINLLSIVITSRVQYHPPSRSTDNITNTVCRSQGFKFQI